EVTEDATYTAAYTSTVNQYSVTFVDENGTVLKAAALYDYGTVAEAIEKPADPNKEATAQYTYAFAGWTPEITEVTEDATYTATYTSTVNRYSVTFVDEDGTVLKAAEQYDYGTAAEAIEKPADPTRGATAQYTYTFTGWTPEIAEVTEDTTYTATYNRTARIYTITFDTDGGSTIDSITLPYGTPITTPANPTKDDLIFAKWEPALPATMPAENLTVKAVYVSEYGTPDFTLPAFLKTVEENAFEGASMTVVYVPDTCTSVGKEAFKNCENLTQIRLPKNCAINEHAFDGCTALTAIYAPAGGTTEQWCKDNPAIPFVAE
ncbi:MAG: InlB B-repeat-containing protein, partial [Oscillospiraceae bacterium]|nr:InlB B-repeat-containing protein [Oscillospiraceae bacterium]